MNRACWLRLTAPLQAVFLLSISAARPALAQTIGTGAEDDVGAWRVVISLVVCVALAAAGALVLKKRSGQGTGFTWFHASERRLRVLESVRLSRETMLSIVAVDGNQLLVLSGQEGASIVREISPGVGDQPAFSQSSQ